MSAFADGAWDGPREGSDDAEPFAGDTVPCGWCDARIDLDDHMFKPHPESGGYLCVDCREQGADEPRDTVPMPVDSAGGFPIEGTEAAPSIEEQIERLHFFMTVSPFAGKP